MKSWKSLMMTGTRYHPPSPGSRWLAMLRGQRWAVLNTDQGEDNLNMNIKRFCWDASINCSFLGKFEMDKENVKTGKGRWKGLQLLVMNCKNRYIRRKWKACKKDFHTTKVVSVLTWVNIFLLSDCLLSVIFTPFFLLLQSKTILLKERHYWLFFD